MLWLLSSLSSLPRLATPMHLSLWWNLGSLLGVLMSVQIVTGWLMTLVYVPDVSLAFGSVWVAHLDHFHVMWVHWFHLNGASALFLMGYLHLLKGLYNSSWKSSKIVWMSGVVILLLLMAVAFLGYVLPFGQMSLWAATVICNLLSVLHPALVIWIWAGYSVNASTVLLFYTLHYSLGLAVLGLVAVHIWCLHLSGSQSPVTPFVKMQFSSLYIWKDLLNVIIVFGFIIMVVAYPYVVADVEGFTPANPLVSPVHIQPEWYYLQWYAILRCIPNKVGGVLCFAGSVFWLGILVICSSMVMDSWSPLWCIWVSSFVAVLVGLMILGGAPVEAPYLAAAQMMTVMYFAWLVITSSMSA